MPVQSSKRSNSDQSKSVEHLKSVHSSDFYNALIISQNQLFFKRMPNQLSERIFPKIFYHVTEQPQNSPQKSFQPKIFFLHLGSICPFKCIFELFQISLFLFKTPITWVMWHDKPKFKCIMSLFKTHFRSQYFEFALKFEFRTKSGCTRIWFCHVTGVSITTRRNVKWLENTFEFGINDTVSLGWIPRILGFSSPMDGFLFWIAEFVELSKSFQNILNLDRFPGNFDQKIHF